MTEQMNLIVTPEDPAYSAALELVKMREERHEQKKIMIEKTKALVEILRGQGRDQIQVENYNLIVNHHEAKESVKIKKQG